jgi:hypothetical protein
MRGPDLVFVAAAFLGAPACWTPSTAFAQTEPARSNPPAAQAREVELVRSPSPRTLDEPGRDGLSAEAARLLASILLCDPVACLGEAPKLVFASGKWTIRFPASYRKPDTETKDPSGTSPVRLK